MQGFLVLLVVGIVFGPIILSIIALSTASRASREVRELMARFAGSGVDLPERRLQSPVMNPAASTFA